MNEVGNIIQKKKWYKRKWPYIVLVGCLVVGGVVYGQYQKSRETPKYETVKVERGVLRQTVDATGNVESANDLSLRFETAGRLVGLYKQVNNQVRKGEVIAELNLSELNASVAQAQAAVAKAEADLNKQLSGNTSEYIAGLEASLAKALADLDQIQGSAPGAENSKIVQKAYEDALVTLQAVQNVLSVSLTVADNILGVDNTLANDDFEDVLSVLDNGALNSAKIKFYAAKAAKIDFDVLVNDLDKKSEHPKIDAVALQGDDALQAAKDLLLAISTVLEKTVPIGDLSQSELDGIKTDVQTERTSVNTKYGELVNQTQAIDTARNTFYSYQALVDKAEAALNDAKNPPREVDVAAYRAALQSAQASLAAAVANRDKARIIAPVNGVIGKIIPQVGEYVSAQNDVVKLVSPHFEIKIDIPETDIIKIALGNEAQVTLDAYGDEVKFKGKVTEIEKGETIIQDVVYYTVTVSLDEKTDKEILNGMTADVMFYTEQRDNVLFLPLRAVRSNGEGKYVKVLNQSEAQEIKVKTGLRGDGGMVEIIEGLSEGQEVILATVEQKL